MLKQQKCHHSETVSKKTTCGTTEYKHLTCPYLGKETSDKISKGSSKQWLEFCILMHHSVLL